MEKLIKVYGIVQGVGFRPTVSRHAATSGVTGYVCNKGPFVEIAAQGTSEAIDLFVNLIETKPPKRAAILKIDVKDSEEKNRYSSFEIVESEKTSGEIFVSPDIAICDECLSELFNPSDRRYLHPFINCTCCGPRLTILDSLPYDRPRTSMRKFPMCPECEKEYYSPESRRFDAQPVCCNNCGPEVYVVGGTECGRDAIIRARKEIASGKIIAVKGIGGFHLCCNALDDEAVMRLRDLKSRPQKPFAVMLKDMSVVERECEVTPAKEEILTGHQKPILLLNKKAGGRLSEYIAPNNPTVGVMLPYAPLHALLFDYPDGLEMPDCFVMTSGNVAGAPICSSDEEAIDMIGGFCDLILSHNRDINIRTDDSVMDFIDSEGKPYMIRRSRGYAPLPYMMSQHFEGEVVSFGGDLKNTFCIAKNNLFYPSSYIGDMADLRSSEILKSSLERMQHLLETDCKYGVVDLHPRYNSTAVAEGLDMKLIHVQHHFAHILSCMAENDWHANKSNNGYVLGFSMDGTGYGTDGTIWGGELLLCNYSGFKRLAHITPFTHVGGDIASREGYRIAVSMLSDIYGEEAKEVISKLGLCEPSAASAIITMKDKGFNSVKSTSCGRLFDAVAAILGIRLKSTFEGEAACALQFAAEEAEDTPVHEIEYVTQDGDETVIRTDNIVRYLTEEKLRGTDSKVLALCFHKMLARACFEAAEVFEPLNLTLDVALSGGCFQNKLFVKLLKDMLSEYNVMLHGLVPPNDGGLSLGQAVYGMYKLSNNNFEDTNGGETPCV